MSLTIEKLDETWARVTGDWNDVSQLAERFTFEVPGGRFSPNHVNNGGTWDGIIRLLNRATGKIYTGLVPKVIVDAAELEINCTIDSQFRPDTTDYTQQVDNFIDNLGLPFEPHDFQRNVVHLAANRKRMLVVAATSSGKSAVAYMLIKWFNKKTLVISPRKSLVLQLKNDLIDYGCDPNDIHTIMAGSDKNTDKQITVSTWQSLAKMPKKYFEQFETLIGDEVHLFEAKSLVGIVEKMGNAKYRFGLSGSLKEAKTHKLVLTGLFGGIYEAISTREMIDRKISSDVEIIVLVFVHGEETQRLLPFRHTYQQENDVILSNARRNKYIVNLTKSLAGNTIVMFRKKDKHGKILYNLIVESGKIAHYIDGDVDADIREEIRQYLETVDDEVLVSSSGTTSTGTSINNIQNMIQTNALKAEVDVAQTLGRGLRRDGKSNMLKFFDLADKFVRNTGKSKEHGYSYKHLLKRLEIYTAKQLPYKIIEIPL